MSAGFTQRVRPAGAGHETLYVALAAVLILLLAAAVVALRGVREDDTPIAAHQLDARRDLTAAEQGLYTDLHVAVDEIRTLREEQGGVPTPEALAAEGLPPFVDDASSARRGQHRWQWLPQGAFVGHTQMPEVAGSVLLMLPDDDSLPTAIWLRRGDSVVLPSELRPQTLIDAGWQQIVSHYDAGVTRQQRH